MPEITWSDQTKKRIASINEASLNPYHRLTDTELQWLKTATIIADRGSGGDSPQALDILCISAPVDNVKACLTPSWIPVRCHHGNRTWKTVRCRNCDGCRHAWRAKVRAIILDGCLGKKAYMWTVTIKEYPNQMKGERFDVAQGYWHTMLRNMSRESFSFEYLRVVELQKRGTPHFHVVVKEVRGNKDLSSTANVGAVLRGFARRAGFGRIMDFQQARLSGAGVASYMSKYLEKSEDYNALRREDGRAIRRYCRSRGWSNPRALPVWRYARCGDLSHTWQSTEDLRCDCGQGWIMDRDIQVAKWLAANRREGSWVAPLGVADYILEKGKVE